MTVTVTVARYGEPMNEPGKLTYRTLPLAPDVPVERFEGG